MRRPPVIALLLPTLFCLLSACSGSETIAGDITQFQAAKLTRYAWRSEALGEPKGSLRETRLYEVDPIIREAVDDRLQALGYQLVNRGDAQFLVEYMASQGINAGLLSTQSSSVYPYPTTSGTINRLPDGASIDNAYALAGPVETGKLRILFLNQDATALFWQVLVSSVIENVNEIDPDAVKRAVKRGLATVPAAS